MRHSHGSGSGQSWAAGVQRQTHGEEGVGAWRVSGEGGWGAWRGARGEEGGGEPGGSREREGWGAWRVQGEEGRGGSGGAGEKRGAGAGWWGLETGEHEETQQSEPQSVRRSLCARPYASQVLSHILTTLLDKFLTTFYS